MSFNIRKLNSSDYDNILVGWWKDWGWEPPAKDFLPDNGEGGLLVLDDNTPVCSGFIYITNSKVAWINWIISDKNFEDKKIRNIAIEMLLNNLVKMATKNNNSYVFASNNNLSLVDRFTNIGFVKGCENTTEIILKI